MKTTTTTTFLSLALVIGKISARAVPSQQSLNVSVIDNSYEAIGRGIDIRKPFDVTRLDSATTIQLFDENTFETYNLDTTKSVDKTFQSSTEFSNSFSVEAGIEVKAGAFKGSVTSRIDEGTQKKDVYYWARMEEHIYQKSISMSHSSVATKLAEQVTQALNLLLEQVNPIEVLDQSLTRMPSDFNDSEIKIVTFLQQYGTHFVKKVIFGGTMSTTRWNKQSSLVTFSNFEAGASAEYGIISGKASTEIRKEHKDYVDETSSDTLVLGGTSVERAALRNLLVGLDDKEIQTQLTEYRNNWLTSLENKAVAVGYELSPLPDALPSHLYSSLKPALIAGVSM
eukprot:Awhi_evm2s2417